MGVKPGDQPGLVEGQAGFILRPSRIDYSRLGTLKDKIKPGHPPFDIRTFRERPYDPGLARLIHRFW